MPQAVDCDLFLYAGDICLLFHHKDLGRVKEELTKNFSNICDWFVKEELTKNFSNICDWFVDNKLSIHFREDKTKSILLSFSIPKTEKGKYLPVSE